MFFIKTFSILVLSFLLTLFLPWWGIALAAFIIGLALSNKPGNNFLAGLLGAGLFWFGYAFYIDIRNDHQFSGMIAQLFSDGLGKSVSSHVLLIITTLIGALLGGLSAMAGAMILDNGVRHKKALRSGKYTMNIK